MLVVRVGAMGDVLHGLPAVSALRTRLPGASIGWVIDPHWSPLLAGSGASVDRVHLARTTLWKSRPFSGETARSILKLRRELRAKRYDVCVDLQGSMRSAAIAWMSGARRIVGPAVPREALAAWLYNEPVGTRARSVIAQACELVSVAVGRRLVPAAVALPHDRVAEEWCVRTVGRPAAYLLVPGAGWGAKRWPAERFTELARTLLGRGERVLINAGSEDDALSRQIAGRCGAERIVSGVAELVEMTRTAKLVVGGDTGPVHLAAALGRPTVALFGPTDPARNGPSFPGARVRVLRHVQSSTSYKRRNEIDPALAEISVQQVLDAADDLLQDGADE